MAKQTSQQLLQQAVQLHRQGQLTQAKQLYRQIKKKHPEYAESLRLQGLLAQQQGHSQQAIKLLREAAKLAPKQAVFQHSLAEAYQASQQYSLAIQHYRKAWQLQPQTLALGQDLADAQQRAGDSQGAINTYLQLLKVASAAVAFHHKLIELYYERGELQLAAEHLDRWQQNIKDTATDWLALGQGWARIFATDKAADCFQKAADLNQETSASNSQLSAQIYSALGSALQRQGQLDLAFKHQVQATQLNPQAGRVYPALVANKSARLAPKQIEQLTQLASDTRIDGWQRLHMQFALGSWHDRQGDYATAFDYFKQANQAHSQIKPFHAEQFKARLQRIQQKLTQPFFAKHTKDPAASNSQRPVFIVGMPRSGTSLVEQIIASHPQAFGAGELQDISRIGRDISFITQQQHGYPDGLMQLKSTQVKSLAQRYLNSLAARDAQALRVTDKMPFNFYWLGLIARLFPQAKVIYCRRNAMDNCLSCYFNVFNDGLRFTYSLEHLGLVYRLHEQLMAHWQTHAPLDILTLDYEDMVDNPAEQSRRLINFIGLDWDERCLNFHQTQRSVHTASTWQVRQPIYKTSVQRWHNYQPWLTPLKQSLTP